MIGKLANADAYKSDTLDGTGHIRVKVKSSCVTIEYVKAYLPKDTLDGKHHNGEIGFSYTIGKCGTSSTTSISETKMSVYPNPAKDRLIIKLPQAVDQLNINIFNALGELQLESQFNEIDISQLNNGLYYVTAKGENFSATQKSSFKNNTMQYRPLYLVIFGILGLNFHMANAQTLRHTEMLSRPTDKEITLQIAFTDTCEAYIKYGTTSGNYSAQTKWQGMRKDNPTEMVIGNLQPNTQYFYRLVYRSIGSTTETSRPEYSFHTARTAGQSFTFTVQADPHMDEQSDSAVYRRCLLNQLEDKPDFMIDLGDILMSDKLKSATTRQIPRDTVTYRSHLMRSYYELICHSVPLYIAIGNHEGESGWANTGKSNCVPVWGTVDRKSTSPTQNPMRFTRETRPHIHL